VVIFKNKSNLYKVVGVIIGFIGAALLIFLGKAEGANSNLWYGLFVVFGTMCYGTSGNLVKEYFQNVESIIISATSFFLIGTPAIVYLLYSGTLTNITWTVDHSYSIGAILLLSLIGTVLATIIFYKLIQDTNAVFGSSVAYIMPVVAMIWGVFDGEPIGLVVILSMILILTGVYLIKKQST